MKTILRLWALVPTLALLGLPAISWAQTCNQISKLDYTPTANTTVDKRTATETVSGTSYTASQYSSTVTSGQTNRFELATDATLASRALVWQQNNVGRNPTGSPAAPNVSTVTFTFTRPVSNFAITITDIDRNTTSANFTDRLTFDGYATTAATTPVTLVPTNVAIGTSNVNQFVGSGSGATGTSTPAAKNNAVTGTASSAASAAGNVTVTFATPIQKLVLTYENIAAYTNNTTDRTQTLGITQMSWCTEADIATTIAGPTRAQASSQVTYSMTTINNGPDVPATLTPTLQLPTGLSGVTVNSGGTYSSTTGLVSFSTIANLPLNKSVPNSVTFTMPAANSATGTAGYTSSQLDIVPANNTATLTTAQNRAPVASNVTNSPAILSSTTSQTNIAPFNASDPDATNGNTTIVSYTIVSLPTAAQGTLYVNGTAATLNQVITVPTTATAGNPGYQLSFVPVGAFGGNATFTYKATDDVNVSSNTATYTVPVTAGADLVSTVSGQTTAVEGQSKTYSITTTNNGPATATNVVPTLTLSNKPGFSSVTVTNGSYDANTGVVTFSTTTSLASGAAVTNSVTVVAVLPTAPATSFTVTAANTSATTDPAPNNNNGTATNAILNVTVSLIGPAGVASACATPGRDGSPTITASPNTYYPAANQTVAAGDKSLSVGAAVGTTPIAAGDLLLVIQMQGADIDYTNTDAYGDGVSGGAATSYLINGNFLAGQYEYVVAAGAVPVGGGTVTTTTGLKYSYQNAAATTTTGQRRFQVVRIPQYQNLTINGTVSPAAWNGSTGGILALDVTGQLTFASGAKLDASGLGFRGGAGQQVTGTTSTSYTATDYRATASTSSTSTTGAHAMKGEGIVGTPRYVSTGTTLLDTGVEGYPGGSAGRGAPGNAGGGGTDNEPSDNRYNSGGGGGGNGARGGRGGNAWNSGAAVGGEPGVGFSAPSTSRLILGGGGGAGVNNSNSGGGPTPGYASSGAAGGGIVLLRTGSVKGSGAVLANGASAGNAVLNDGSGGGGAGGSILITANNTASLGSLTLAANGGSGGTNTGGGAGPHGPGGGGGGGVVLTNAAPNSASAVAGTNGTTDGNSAYGATAGMPGITNSQVSNSIAGSASGISCSVDVVATTSAPSAAAVGQTVSLSATFANNGGQPASTVTRTVTLNSGNVNNPVTNVVASGSTSISSPDATTGAVTITYPGVSSLAAGGSEVFGISYTAPGTSSVVATSTATTTSTEPVTTNNTNAATTAINGYADVVSAVFGLSSSTTGRPTATYAAVFANNGPAAAANVTRTVTLPAGATLTTAQLKVITDQGGTYNSGTQVIDFGTVATLDSKAASVFQFGYTASNTGGSANITSNIGTTTAQDANGGTGTAPDQFAFAVTNNATSDLATTSVTVSAATVVPGQQASFTINFANNGPADSPSALRYAQLTPGLSGVSVTNNGTYDPATGIITYPAIALANGATSPSVVTFTAPTVGPVNVSGSLSGGGGSASSGIFGNNQATGSIAVTPVADVATTISGPTSAIPGNLVTFSVTTANNGPSAAAAVGQTVQLPKNLSGVFPTNNGTYDANSGVVTFPTLAGLASGAVVNNSVSFAMPTAAFTASAAVTTTTSEASGTTANNAATAAATNPATATTDQANVYTLILSDRNVAPGAPLTFNILTGNNGPNPALNVAQQLLLPPGLSVSSITGGGTYNATTGLVTFPTLASQASGASVSNTVVLTAPATGPLVATASVSSTTSDPVPADNVVIRNVNIISAADIATTLVGPGIAASTQVPTFTVTTINRGPVTAANVVQTVAIPAGFAPADVTASNGGVYDPATGLITWPAVGTLGVEEVRTYTYSYVAPALASTDANNPRTIVSRANVTSATPDAVPNNNFATVATDIKWNADVTVAVAGPAVALLGNSVTFTVATINNGPAPATNVSTTVRIATGLSNVTASGGGSYDASTGLVTFPTIANQVVGPIGAVTNTITLTVPDRPIIGVSAAANSAANDINLTNNAATLVIPVSPRTSAQVDLQTTITSNVSSQQAGQPIVFTVKAINGGPGTSAMRERVALPAGLSNVVVLDKDGTTVLANAYDAASGTVTFPTVTGQTSGTTLTYQITVNTPGTDPLVATASVNGNFSDPTPANNTATVSVTIVPVADVATLVNGPARSLASSPVTYQVVTLNNGPSPANAVVQTVQLPTGLPDVVPSGGGTYDATSGVVTFPKIATQAVGKVGEVTNTISFTFPTTSSTITGTVTSGTGENGATANNTSTRTTVLGNPLQLANMSVNRLQTPQSNTATALTLSALTGFDPEGSLASFSIATLPAASAGTLALNGTAVQVGQIISLANAAKLTFDPASTFVGNAFFTFTALNGNGISSDPTLYTIPVGQDNASVYTTTAPKGGSNAYQNGDVLANVFDANGGTYNATAAVADNGVRTASVSSSSLPAGTQLDPMTGQITVADRTLLVTGTYPVSITTVDVNGGTNTQTVPLRIGANPLPVTLTRFEAQAADLDGRLSWATAQENNNAGFDVERSFDGTTFAALTFVAGAGTSPQAHTYAYVDAGVGQQHRTVYYRLQQRDLAGTTTYSPVRVVAFAGPALAPGVALYPNPAFDQTTLDLTELPMGSYQVQVLDLVGRLVQAHTLAGGLSHSLTLSDLPSGSYVVLISNGMLKFSQRLSKY